MSEFFYGNSPVAVEATTQQLLQEVDYAQNLIKKQQNSIELVAINTLYRTSIICREGKELVVYSTYNGKLKRDYIFYSKWKDAPNYIQINDIGIGQQELF